MSIVTTWGGGPSKRDLVSEATPQRLAEMTEGATRELYFNCLRGKMN
jgi:hypothetical protein